MLSLLLLQLLVDNLMEKVWEERGVPFTAWNVVGSVVANIKMFLVTVFVQAIVLIVTLPLNAIPVVGTVIYCYINGILYSWDRQLKYHVEVLGWSFQQSRRYALGYIGDYAGFGMVAVALQMVPVVNVLFVFTNAIGAALWSADDWKQRQQQQQQA